ncbi:NMDA receptor synaptonuclear signaling and neuronal migration factor-like, partial [Notothenia coriiceps]|uniref:NMDA receptor synaptonuclear signaling and neuronal migration factor-like n=1 Tax=Notothenia coriiceps TaxID=8208 RepID=A0A6I9N4Z7_9TELE
AARAFGEYLSHTNPENRNGSAHLLCETLVGPDPESPSDKIGPNNNNHLHPCSNTTKGCEENRDPGQVKPTLGLHQPPPPSITISTKASKLSLERSFSAEEDQQKSVECTLQPARVYTITTQRGMLMSSGRGSKESLELDVLKEKSGSGGVASRSGLIQGSPSSATSSPTQHHHASSSRGNNHHHRNHHDPHHGNHHDPHHGNHHHHGLSGTTSSSGGASGSSSSNQQQQSSAVTGSHSHHGSHHHGHHHHLSQPPLQTSVSAHNIRGWGEGGKGEAECSGLACESCSGAPSRSQGSLDLESASREAGKQHRRLERMWSVDRMTGLEREDTNWFPKENMFSFQTATTTMQAISNFRKHLRMVGSRRMKAQTFAERRSKSFSRSWSDPTPVKNDSQHDTAESNWNASSLLDAFYNGLSDRLKDELAARDLPADLDELVALSIRIDCRLRERRRERVFSVAPQAPSLPSAHATEQILEEA